MAPRQPRESNSDSQQSTDSSDYIDAQELAQLVTIDESFLAQFQGGQAISRDDAIQAFEKRAGKWHREEALVNGATAQVTNLGSGDVFGLIYDSLPEQYRTTEIIAALDVRPYLAQLDGRKIHFEANGGLRQWDVTISTSKQLKDVQNGIASRLPIDPSLPVEQQQAMRDRLLQYDATTAGSNPESNIPAMQAAANGQIGSGFDATTFVDEQTLFPVAELREMVRTGEVSIAQLEQYERQQIEAGVSGTFPIDVTAPWSKGDYSVDYMGVREAMAYLSTLSEQEVTNLQRKLGAAGYFDRTGLGASYVEGDSMDKVTLEAWKLALGDAVAANKSVPAVIMDGMQNYRTKIREARMRDLEKVDPRYSATLASDYAMSVVGRGLSTEEQAALNSYLTDLVQKRAGFVAGANNAGVDGPLPQTPEGFTQSDVQMWVGQQTSAEAALLTSSTRWNR